MSSSSSSSSSSSDNNADPRDPSGYLKLDPHHGRPAHADGREIPAVVKIVGTARDDLNGLLGFCTAYNRDRQRYMVRMASVDSANAPNATVMALKPANLEKASTIETYKAQFQQLRTDPRIRQRLSEYYEKARIRCRPYTLEQVAGFVALCLGLSFYALGFSRTVILLSASIMVGCILVEDVFRHRKPWREVVRNFPSRSKTVIEKQFPVLKGRLSEPVAAGLVGLLLALTFQSVFFTGGKARPGPSPSPSPPAAGMMASNPRPPSALTEHHRDRLEEIYNLGFQDSLDGKERGHSLADELERLLEPPAAAAAHQQPMDDDDDLEDIPPIRYSAAPPPRPPPSFASRLFSFKTLGSVIFLYRTAMQIGVDPSTGIFSVAQLAANIQHNIPVWQKGMIAFSCYNLVSNLLF